ncbi:MAG: NUDIX hydrolase [Paludibacterium sp.]|uniref:NUDIX domain-containing protein n=1 Tax=Paludibacterium sp. TaxID=1917523 RepID=UPI002600BE00|nr:NUDIX hydrolase [Paludibacterium sp.]MBV8048897.1 NUDIX hydrolase [Paludibacterium sp.]MBV8648408.1 NUDIX hydrolase [Paludibacterium sp.]
MTQEIVCLDSKEVYRNRWMRVREDRVRRASGAEGLFGIVEKNDYAAILALDGDRIHLVSQYRYPVGQRYWELPQGMWEDLPDVDPCVLAAAELREETGYSAGRMQPIGKLFPAYGFCAQVCHVFVATELTAGERDLDPEEEGLESRWFTLAEMERMIIAGEIMDSSTIAAFALARAQGMLPG